MGLLAATSIVVGNMVASGIFMLPASLASYGNISLISWVLSGIGAIALALIYSWLARIMPIAQGGPYAYSRAGVGDFAGFWVSWAYWISVWCTNAALAIACVSYLTTFIPVLGTNTLAAVTTGLGIIWFLTYVNLTGVRNAGLMQVITTVAKMIPLIMISVGGLMYLHSDHFNVFNRSQDTNVHALLKTTTLTFFAFLGLECATIPSTSVNNPEITIPKATTYGTLLSTIIYLLSTISVMGILSPEVLVNSKAPLADAAQSIWGNWARILVGAGAVISTFGALNGWILMQGQIPEATSIDGLLPKVFSKTNKRKTPYFSLIFSSILVSILMFLNYQKSLAKAYEFAILLSTLSVLIPYIFSVVSFIIISPKLNWKHYSIAGIAFLFGLIAIIGSGAEITFWGFVLMIAALPLYAMIKSNTKSV